MLSLLACTGDGDAPCDPVEDTAGSDLDTGDKTETIADRDRDGSTAQRTDQADHPAPRLADGQEATPVYEDRLVVSSVAQQHAW